MDRSRVQVVPISSGTTDTPPYIRDTRQPYQKELAVHLLLASVFFERVAFYALASNLVVYLESKRLHWDYNYGATAVNLFYGASYIWTVLFAILSDIKLGRIKTIIIGFVIYLMGFSLMTVIARGTTSICEFNVTMPFPEDSIINQPCSPAILSALMLTAMGAGGVKATLCVFGAEQIQEGKRAWIYFDKYVVAANLGNFVATSAIPYIQNPNETYSFLAYLISTGMLLIAMLLFLLSTRYSLHIEVSHTVVTKCLPVVFNAFQTWWKRKRSSDEERIIPRHANIQTEFGNSVDNGSEVNQSPTSFLDYAKETHQGKFSDRIVEDVKSLQRVLFLFILLIPFSLIYCQSDATFPLQGKQMYGNDLRTVSLMALANPVIIIMGILIQNLFPCQWLQNADRAIVLLKKFIIGMIIASIAMVVASGIEGVRQSMCEDGKSQSNLPIYYQLFEHMGIGFAELFVTVASYKYAYFAGPREANSLSVSFRFFSIGAASFLGVGYMGIFSKSSSQIDFNCKTDPSMRWTFYVYYLILAVIQLIFLVIFIVCQKKFGIVRLIPEKIEQKRYSLFFTTQSESSETYFDGVF